MRRANEQQTDMGPPRRTVKVEGMGPAGAVAVTLAVIGVVSAGVASVGRPTGAPDANKLLIVDCLLPPVVRRLGGGMIYSPPRMPVRTSADDCEIRGGEYVAYDRANYATALQVWLAQAKSNDPQAQTYVGEIYEKGMGVTPNYVEAASWYEKAANQNYARAQSNLAYLYEKGLGVQKDPVKALNLYRKSAGLTDNDLTFTSDVESVRSEMQAQIDDLSAQLEQQNAAAESLRSDLATTQKELAARKSSVAAAQRDARALRARIEELEAAGAGASVQQLAELHEARSDLGTREQRLAQQQAEMTKLEQESVQQQAQLSARLKEADGQQAQLRRQIDDQAASAATARSQLAGAQARLQSMTDQVSQLNSELAAAKASLKTKEDRLQQQVRAPNVNPGEVERARVALAAETALVADREAVITQLESHAKDYKAEVERLKAQVDASEEARRKQTAELATTRSQLQTERAQLAVLGQRVQQTELQLAQANESLASERQRLARERQQLESDQARSTEAAQAEIKKRTREVAALEAQVATQNATIAGLEKEQRLYQQQIVDLKSSPAALAMRSPEPRAATASPPLPKRAPAGIDLGEYHALIIGNNNYAFMPGLETAINDAKAIDATLKTKYGFQTKVLLNATRAEIFVALRELHDRLSVHDNLLIYYAGHGQRDPTNSARGYWLPVDAKLDDMSAWIPDDQITSQIGNMAALHVLVVADSCYAGALTREPPQHLSSVSGGDDGALKLLKLLAKLPSRTVMTSGGNAPVLDNGAQGHSIFARAFVEFLNHNDHIVEAQGVYNEIFQPVRQSAMRLKQVQEPRYVALREAGHENGDFLFSPTS
jgi:predicted  nucleic acid-binding Zn-ribbon protein